MRAGCPPPSRAWAQRRRLVRALDVTFLVYVIDAFAAPPPDHACAVHTTEQPPVRTSLTAPMRDEQQ
jgi:hypothetical protein